MHGARLLLVPLLPFQGGLLPTQLLAAETEGWLQGNVQKSANPTHFKPQLGTHLASVVEIFGW